MSSSHSKDYAQAVREEDRLDIASLKKYLSENFVGINDLKDLNVPHFSAGASNLTYQLQWNDQKVILRTAPHGANIKSAHNMSREYHVLKALEPYFEYSPKALLYCDDKEIIGKPFYIMEKIDGVIAGKEFPMKLNSDQADDLCKQLLDIQVKLHEIDIAETGLCKLGKPQGYIQRQVEGWNGRYENALLNDSLPAIELRSWLLKNQPNDTSGSMIHNDYKFDNVVISPYEPYQIIGVLDWELATVGSPLMDLGCSLAYWVEKNDAKEMQMIRRMPTSLDGMWSRNQIVEYYCSKRNISSEGFDYFYIFGLFRLAVIAQQIYKRYATGKTTNPVFANFGELVKILLRQAEKQI